jgi:site-specific DNA recombinase
MTRRAALYARVSDTKAGKSRSVAEQAEAGRAALKGCWTINEYSETGSASRFATRNRPEWNRLQDDVRAGMFDCIILWEPSRGGRELQAWAAFLNVCRAARCRIYITSHNQLYDLSRARDWRSLAEDGIDSEYESEKTSLRLKRAFAAAKAAGRPIGRVPYGYLRVADPVTRVVTQHPDPERAPLVAEVCERIAASEAVSRITRDLAARGIVTDAGRPWTRASVTSLIRPAIIGKLRSTDGALIDAQWPPLVSEDVYWAARRVLEDPKRQAMAGRRGGLRPGGAKWLLSYVATCAKCGGPLTVQMRKAGPQYRCASSAGGCAYMPVPLMDGLVSAAIVAWCARPEIFAELTRIDSDPAAAAARGEASAARAQLAEFESAAADCQISAESFARIAVAIETRIADADRRARDTWVSPALRGLLKAAEASDDRALVIGQMWAGMTLAARRSVVRTLCDVTLAPVGPELAADSPWRVSIAWH